MKFERKHGRSVRFDTVRAGEVFVFHSCMEVPYLKVPNGMVHSHRKNVVCEQVEAICLLDGHAFEGPIHESAAVWVVQGKFVEE